MRFQINKAKCLALTGVSFKSPIFGWASLFSIALNLGFVFIAPCHAQYSGIGTSTLQGPLISGASNTLSGQAASPGLPPAIGSGAVPLPVNPGMLGAPTLLPWVPLIPATQIDQQSSRVSLGAGPATLSAPEKLGPSLTVPGAPSTPGNDPGILSSPSSAAKVQITGSGMPPGAAPLKRRAGQTTKDFGLTKASGSQTTYLGKKLTNPYGALQISEDGPRNSTYPGSQAVNHQPYFAKSQMTTDQYGIPIQSPSNGTAVQTVANY